MTIKKQGKPSVTCIVIGLNEENNLRQSLCSVMNSLKENEHVEVIYVDSGSTDNSVAIATSIDNVNVVHLDVSQPSAAKGRNCGLELASGEFIQFLDGDSVLDPQWLTLAMAFLREHQDYACVFGGLIEENTQHNIYTRLCAIDWHITPGDYRLCGGNALWRKSDLDSVHGFDTAMQVGEEPDLCYRIRQQNRKIRCLDIPMAKHDLEMHSFRDYWARGINNGVAYAAVGMRYRYMPEKLWLREMLRNFVEPVVWLMVLFVGLMFFSVAVAVTLLLALVLLRAIMIAVSSRNKTLSILQGVAYGLHLQLIRIPVVIGQLKYLFMMRG